jgi:YD repeat-containing protein
MSRCSHLLVSLCFCLLFVASFFTPSTSSQSTLRSLSLNGTTAYAEVPNSATLNITGPITVEAWIKVNAIDGNHHDVVSRIDRNTAGSGGGYALSVNGVGKTRLDLFQSHTTYTTVIGTTVLSTGVWHHVAGVFDGSQMRVYLNGVLDGSLSTTNAPGSGTSLLRIGRAAHAALSPPLYLPSFAFAGLIDEVRVSAAALYSSNFTPGLGPGSNVKGLWKFDGSTPNDFSGNGNNAALQGGASYSTDVPSTPNSAPSVSLTHPLNNTSFAAGSNIVMDATASDSDGSVTKVDFYQGTTLLGTDTTAPYTFVWSNVPASAYSLTAKATDDGNATTTSSAVAVTVIAPGGYHSLSLNGTNQYVMAPSSTSLNITGAITVEGWIKLSSIGAYQAIVSREAFQQAGTGGGYRLAVTDAGKLRLDLFQSHNTYTTAIGTTAITTGVWHHVAGVFDGSQMRVYVDGVLNGSVSTTNGPASGTGGFYIGRFSYSFNPYYFGGLIDEVRVSAAALYSSNFTPGLGPSSNVKGLWKFDGQTPNDFSGNGNHGTLQNGPGYSNDVPSTGGGGSQRPVPVAGGPYSGQLGQAVLFSSSGSFDPDGTVAAYHWNFGDGTSANTANPSHTYAAPGLYTATLTVTDNAGLLASATATVTISNGGNARLDPLNQTGGSGENPLSQNFNWTLPLVGLPGRAGMDLNLSLSYNSLVWTKSGSNYISFDDDHGFPGPGFRLGFPVIQPLYFNAEVGKYAFILIGSDGSRTELRRVGTSALYEAADSSHLLLDANTMVLRATDGTQLKYELKGSEYQCAEIKDRNGNYITINYMPSGRIATIVDTLERIIEFNYDANGWLTSIEQTWNQGPSSTQHIWASFEYTETTIQTDFTNLTVSGPSNGSKIKTLSRVSFPVGSHYDFSYTSWGQVWKVSSFAADNHLLNYRSYNLPGSPLQTTGPQTDCPRFTERRDWAENWNENTSGVEQEAVTTYATPVADTWTMPDNTPPKTGLRAQVTAPDLTSNKIYFVDPAGTTSDWQRGLPALVNTYDSSGALQRQVMTTWTQDNTSVSYPLNPRVIETKTYDPAGNRARVQITYQQVTFTNGTSCQLPRDIYEYAANATTILRSTRTDYHTSTAYTDRRIIGLVSEKRLYEGDVNNATSVRLSKVGFFYDNENASSSIQADDAPVQHDNDNYSASFVTGRANLSSVRRYNVTNTAQFTTTRSKYNTAGAVVSTKDALDHEVKFSYADSFSDEVSRNTLAYPTKLTDPDGYYSTSKYNYDFGALTYKRTPPPNFNGAPIDQPGGPEQTFAYDAIGRLQQVTNEVNEAYTRYVYPTSQTRYDTYTTIQDGLGEAHSFKFTDGAGRVIATAADHNLSTFSGQKMVYDKMGRVIKTSNPTETTASGAPSQWNTAGDDDGAGWIYTEQTYDWKGRPLVTTNQDGTTKTASYSGCGCAGGEVVTLTDEGTIDGGVAKRRQQKIYSDVLGRTVKTEILNWQGGSVYSATVNTYNARDQVTQIRQYAGAEGSGTYQDTTMAYDGHGRLQSRHLPQQDTGTATVWTYNADDTVNTVTDARGASSAFTHNNGRHLPNVITHTMSGSSLIVESFEYDAAGNRTSMSDSSGGTTYQYNQLSQLTSETRTFTGLSGSYTLSYEYNYAGQLKSLTDHTQQRINYAYDASGRLNGVTGTNYTNGQFIDSINYRAWGAPRQITYGYGPIESLAYTPRLMVDHYEMSVSGFGTVRSINYQYYNDTRLKFFEDVQDHRFDRSYEYNHVAGLTKALSGAEARSEPPTTDRPYKESATYDEFGHLKTRSSLHWSRTLGFGSSDTYSNNRRVGWTYDIDGNWLSGAGRQHTYDAAGRNNTTIWTAGGYLNQFYDGDGQRVKSTEPNVVTYYLRSTALGGQILEQLDSTGAKQKGFVYAAGQVIGEQSGTGNVLLLYGEPSGVSVRASSPLSSLVLDRLEMDPWGAEVYSSDPYLQDPGFSGGRGEGGPVFPGAGDISMPSTGCSRLLDGVLTLCDFADRNLNGGGIQVERLLRSGRTQRLSLDVTLGIARIWHHPHSGNSPMIMNYSGPILVIETDNSEPGYWDTVDLAIGQDDLAAYRARIAQMLKDKKCATFITQLLNEAKMLTGRDNRDVLTTFDSVKFYWAALPSWKGGEAQYRDGKPVADINNTVKTEKFISADRSAFLVSSTTNSFLAETLHHTAIGSTYADGVMAQALNNILVREGKDHPQTFDLRDSNDAAVRTSGLYWHPKLENHCRAPRR